MKLNLKNITIVSINGRDPENSAKAINYSCKDINFGNKILITNSNCSFEDIKVIKYDKLNSFPDYNYFCVKELTNYIETEYCLLVQPDGFIINPRLWTDFFFEYDYIGAPWDVNLTKRALQVANMQSTVSNIVGNGGFSLRSKKLLNETSKLDYIDTNVEEDIFITISSRKILKEKGIKYAPVDIAQQFSLESYINEKSLVGNSFGFHGNKKYYLHFKELYDRLL